MHYGRPAERCEVVLTVREIKGADAARRWIWLIAPTVVGVLPFLVVTVVSLDNAGRTGVNRGDYAFIELATRSALRGQALLGPYSRFGWNHPGPAMFYWDAGFYRAFGQTAGSLGLATTVMHTLMTATVVIVAGIASGRRAAWMAAASLLTIPWLWGMGWIDGNWNPILMLTAVIATAFLAAGVLAGRRWMLVPLVATASFTVQTHVGTAPLVVLLALTSVVGLAWSMRAPWRTAWRPWAAPGAAAIAVGSLLWALPIYEQGTSEPGNLGELVRFTRSLHGSHGFREVLDKVAVQLTLSSGDLIGNVASPTRAVPAATPGRTLLLVGLLGAVALGLVLNLRARRRFEQHLCTVALVATVAVFVAGTRVAGALMGYLTLPATAVGTLLWSAVALTAAAEVADRVGAPASWRPFWLVAGATTAASVWLTIALVHGHPERSLQSLRLPDPSAEAISDQIRAAIPDGSGAVLIEPAVPNGPAVSTAAMVANQIELGGFDARADPGLDHFFGRERRATGCETVAIRVGNRGQPALPSAGKVIGTFAQQVIQIRDLRPEPGCP